MASQPAWQTEELKEEWPDEGDNASEAHTRSISMTIPVGSLHQPAQNGTDLSQDSDIANVLGTLLIRSGTIPSLPQRTPAQRKGLIKDFFSPIALERMFDPPSSVLPKPNPSPRDDHNSPLQPHIIHAPPVTTISGQSRLSNHRPTAVHSWRPDMSCQFTFSVPHPVALAHITTPSLSQDKNAVSNSAAVAPLTDPPLRLFQFQYDTFTRDHLSAMVDSLAINSPSGSNTGNFVVNTSSPFGLPPVSEASMRSSSHELRSAKRVKISPVSDFHGLKNHTSCGIRRSVYRKDYVRESKFFMSQIKNAKDSFSTSASASSQRYPNLNYTPRSTVPPPTDLDSQGSSKDSSVAGPSGTSTRKGYSSLGYRQQAESLMAQLKWDMKGPKRIFSTDAADTSPSVDDISQFVHPLPISSQNQQRLPPIVQRSSSPKIYPMVVSSLTWYDNAYLLKQDTGTTSLNTSRIYAHFPAPPILVAQPPSPPPQPPVPTSQPNAAAFDVGTAAHSLLPPATRTVATVTISVPGRPNEDLNRFVSSSTASGTTLTAGSSGSFVKHPGPAHITRIGPEDVPALPERVGRMVFDKTMMRWVKASVMEPPRISEGGSGGSAEVDAESEDPFRDIESLRDDSPAGDGPGERAPPSTDNSDADEVGDEEMEFTSFSFDGPSHNRMRAAGVSEDDITDSDNDEDTMNIGAQSTSFSLADMPEVAFEPESSDEETHHNYALPVAKTTISGPPCDVFVPTPIRSALKSAVVSPAVSFVDPVLSSHRNPASKTGRRRSVSFSDGKREGPIRGLGRSAHADSSDGELVSQVPGGNSTFERSARSKRISEMLDGLESIDDKSPRPTSLAHPLAGTSPPCIKPGFGTDDTSDTGVSTSDILKRVAARSQQSTSPNVAVGVGAESNATFLTEASFGVAHDKLVQVITDLQPFEPYWEELSSIDLANKNIDSVARLKEFLPRLHTLSLNSNHLAWLSGVPSSVRSLSASRNSLSKATSFNHLLSLEHLDISYNNVESLSQLECLRHLRELRADGNYIRNIEGLQRMDCLVKLSLQRNRIADLDFTQCSWPKFEVLNASQNRIQCISGLSLLPSLVVLNLDNNAIDELKPHGILPRLRILRLSANRLKCLDAGHFPNLRMLYVDNNALTELKRANRLVRLENLSLRNQGGNELSLLIREVRDVKRLYLSGNALPADFLSEPCYNLIYLEIAACRLSKLPTHFSALVPNLRVLNLNYNFLDDVKSLEGLRRLNKLTIIGSRLKGTKGIIKVLRGCPEVEMVDFRYVLFPGFSMNPCTLGWYLPLLVKDVPGALQPSEAGPRLDVESCGQSAGQHSGPDLGERDKSGANTRGGNRGNPCDGTSGIAPTLAWHELDAKFRRDLPDEAYIGRLTYRGLIMRACPKVRMLDGVVVLRKEREKAEKLLEGLVLAKA
ncbi:hypothetical protein F5148DRAFT_984525 [Russula earlei]|uniref:Uncharacterized protein n=1 Tax=Russula earlei TaxID=71964 RepID=A0ACC0U0I2_9AGAM|nr:hypothetical protein F5148DRAFT_984525 [Russula earlei]